MSPGLALALLLVLALGTRLALWQATAGITMDSPLYVRLAEAMTRGGREPSAAHHGYPLLISVASRFVAGREIPGRLVSLLASLAVVAFTWALARRRTGERGGLVAGALAATHPLLAVYGVAIMTEASWLAVTLAGLWLLERGRAFRGGVVLGLGYWIRPEGLIVAPLAALLTRARRPMIVAMLGTVAAMALYLPVLRWQQGAWTLSPKSVLVRPAERDYREAETSLADSARAAALPPLGTRLGAMATEAPARAARFAARLGEAWPLPLLLVSLLGLRAGIGPWLAPFALYLLYPLLAGPDDIRFAQFAVPGLALLAGAGLEAAFAQRRVWRWGVVALLAAGVAWGWVGDAGRRARHFDDGPMAALRGAGVWLHGNAAPGDLVMDRKAYVPFFATLPHAQLPDDELPAIADYARARGARWLVVEEYVTHGLRPQLAPLLGDSAASRARYGLALTYVSRLAPNEGVAVFRVLR